MGLVSIQRFVIEGGNHLSHRFFGIWARDYRCPGLPGCRFKFGSEAFPLHLEVFVRPGNLYLSVRQVGPVFTNISYAKGEAPTHCFADFLFDFCLSRLPIRPVGLKNFFPVNNLHEGTPFAVTGSPNGFERVPGLHPPSGCSNMVGDLYTKSFGFGIENKNWQKCFDFLSKTVLRLQNCTVSTFLQFKG